MTCTSHLGLIRIIGMLLNRIMLILSFKDNQRRKAKGKRKKEKGEMEKVKGNQ